MLLLLDGFVCIVGSVLLGAIETRAMPIVGDAVEEAAAVRCLITGDTIVDETIVGGSIAGVALV
jgi:hypothetical protein